LKRFIFDFYQAGLVTSTVKKRNPDSHTSSSAPLADKIRNYRDTYRRNRHVALLPACMSTSGRIHGELLRLIFFLSIRTQTLHFQEEWRVLTMLACVLQNGKTPRASPPPLKPTATAGRLTIHFRSRSKNISKRIYVSAISNKQADDDFAALGYQPHKQEFCHRCGVFFHKPGLPSGWHVLRLWRCDDDAF